MRSVQTGAIEHRFVLGSPEQALLTLNEAVAYFAGVAGLTFRCRRDRRKFGGAAASWLFSRLFSGRGWMRGLDIEVGEDRG